MPTVTRYANAFVSGTVTGGANATGAPNNSWTTDTGSTDWTGRWNFNTSGLGTIIGTQSITVTSRKDAPTNTGQPTYVLTIIENNTNIFLLFFLFIFL